MLKYKFSISLKYFRKYHPYKQKYNPNFEGYMMFKAFYYAFYFRVFNKVCKYRYSLYIPFIRDSK